MSDFRTLLYERYVSAFKGDVPDLTRWWPYINRRYFPHIRRLPATAYILELGCGPGVMMSFLREQGYQNVQGIDLSKEQIDIAQRFGLNAQVADVFEYLERLEQSYELIIAIDFFEHFTKEELLQLSELIYQKLNHGGILLLQTPNGAGLLPNQIVYGDLTHCTILNSFSIIQLLKHADFTRIDIFETEPIADSIVSAARFILWKIIRQIPRIIRIIETGHNQKIWTQNMICVAYKGS